MPSQNASWDKSPDPSKKLVSIRNLLKKSPKEEIGKKKSRRRMSNDNLLSRRAQSQGAFSRKMNRSMSRSNHWGHSSLNMSKNDLAWAVMADMCDFEE